MAVKVTIGQIWDGPISKKFKYPVMYLCTRNFFINLQHYEAYKILSRYYNIGPTNFFVLSDTRNARGHHMKLLNATPD